MTNMIAWLRRKRFTDEKLPLKCANAIEFSNLRYDFNENFFKAYGVIEIILANDITLETGTSYALDRLTYQNICTLNYPAHSIIRSICYNHLNDTIITVWHCKSINAGLMISIFHREEVKKGRVVPHKLGDYLQSLVIPYPGFVEFEEPNGRIITSTPQDHFFRFWDMNTYEVAFKTSNLEFKELRISRGTVAFFKQPDNNKLSVKLCDITNGDILALTTVQLLPNQDIRFLELCGCYLLIKQNNACIFVHDLLENTKKEIVNTEHFLPKAEENQKMPIKPSKEATFFLAIHEKKMEIYSCKNGFLTSIGKINLHPLLFPIECLQLVKEKDTLLAYSSGINNYLDLNMSLNHYTKNDPILKEINDRHKKDQTSYNKLTPDNSSNHLYNVFSLYNEQMSCDRYSHLEYNLKSAREYFYPSNKIFSPNYSSSIDSSMKTYKSGISVIDLNTGYPIIFLVLNINDKINTLLYDSKQKEILLGGASGLHRLKSSIVQVDEYLDRNNTEDINMNDKIVCREESISHNSLLEESNFTSVSNNSLETPRHFKRLIKKKKLLDKYKKLNAKLLNYKQPVINASHYPVKMRKHKRCDSSNK